MLIKMRLMRDEEVEAAVMEVKYIYKRGGIIVRVRRGGREEE